MRVKGEVLIILSFFIEDLHFETPRTGENNMKLPTNNYTPLIVRIVARKVEKIAQLSTYFPLDLQANNFTF